MVKEKSETIGMKYINMSNQELLELTREELNEFCDELIKENLLAPAKIIKALIYEIDCVNDEIYRIKYG